ncbi:MAG: hypothetical protein IID15_00775 [Candidatus Marinimicrobia bacterium]|nr:hypothetical protein [Candidatus Neomarinimicrobiota bacterium]
MNLFVCEGSSASTLPPLTDTKPLFDLICGSMSLLDRIKETLGNPEPMLGVRHDLCEVTVETHEGASVNMGSSVPTLLVNGAILWTPHLAATVAVEGPDTVYTSGGITVAARVSSHDWSSSNFANPFSDLDPKLPHVEVDAVVIRRLWDLIRESPRQLAEDLARHPELGNLEGTLHPSVQSVSPDQIRISSTAKIGAGTVLDASGGPIVIDDSVMIGHLAIISGPVYIGPNSTIKNGAQISPGTTIGESCKVGGEVAASIIQSFSNKQHEGFLGHAYIGSWVNLGAGTNNSNLKNNYGSVKIWVGDQVMDSGEMFLGCIIGDHSKVGIGATINTGTVIGTGCNLFGAAMFEKYVPNFSWGEAGALVPFRIEKFLQVAKIVMMRRNKSLTPAMETLLRKLYASSSETPSDFKR